MPLLTTEAFDFSDGHSGDANLVQSVFHFVELERLDDGFDLFHRFDLVSELGTKAGLDLEAFPNDLLYRLAVKCKIQPFALDFRIDPQSNRKINEFKQDQRHDHVVHNSHRDTI